eukprot:GCRY01000201.1.p1 GENE.GCRY01000201.1~~GCRY01000201.1.p1  ORF type:complete len:252 (+),score=30.70 GCRY01000201.1:95-850(+)
MAPLKFFNCDFCPFGARAWLTILEKGIPHEYVEVSLVQKQLFPEFLKASPPGTVPAGFHEDKAIYDSLPMCKYLDKAFPEKSIMPDSPHDCFLYDIHSETWGPTIVQPLFKCLMSQDSAAQDQMKNELTAGLKKLNEWLGEREGPYYFGEKLTLADIALWPMIERVKVLLKHYRNYTIPEEFTNLNKWYDTCLERESFKTLTADRLPRSLAIHEAYYPGGKLKREEYLVQVYEPYATNKIAEFKAKHAPKQ